MLSVSNRVIVLIDMDCFYCQVETKLNPNLRNKPMAVVQYNSWKGGGIIAVNYEARARGVTRYMRGDEAQKHCPEIELVRVATLRDKADLSKYRDASKEVFDVLCKYSDCIERASIDEAYIDLTATVHSQSVSVDVSKLKNTFVIGYSADTQNDEESRSDGTASWLKDVDEGDNDNDKNLAMAGAIVEEMRSRVFEETGFHCSAGIAHNKILAKLVCGLHKPNRQTIMPHSSVPILYATLPVKKVRNLGGKFGDSVMACLNSKVMADLLKYSLADLQKAFDHKNGLWLYNIARGFDDEPVKARLIAKSIGCCKRFPGKNCLSSEEILKPWLVKLSEELEERLNNDISMNKRRASIMTVSATLGSSYQASSKAVPFPQYSSDKIFDSALSAIRKMCVNNQNKTWVPVYCLGISAGKFIPLSSMGSLDSFVKSSSEYFRNSPNEFKAKFESTVEVLSLPIQDSITNSKIKFVSKDGENKKRENQSNNLTPFSGTSQKYSMVNSNMDFEGERSSETAQNSDNGNYECSNTYFGKFLKNCKGSVDNRQDISEVKELNDDNDEVNKFPVASSFQKDLSKIQSDITPSNTLQTQSKVIKESATEKSVTTNKKESVKSKKSWMEKYLTTPKEVGVSVEELFPDLDDIDEELLEALPFSLRQKVLKERHLLNNKKKVIRSNSDKQAGISKFSSVDSTCHTANNHLLNDEASTSSLTVGTEYDNKSDSDSFVCLPDVNEVTKCPKCNELVNSSSFMEHSDRHLAEELQSSYNSSLPLQHTGISSKKQSASAVNIKKQVGKRKQSKIDLTKMKKIKTFFNE